MDSVIADQHGRLEGTRPAAPSGPYRRLEQRSGDPLPLQTIHGRDTDLLNPGAHRLEAQMPDDLAGRPLDRDEAVRTALRGRGEGARLLGGNAGRRDQEAGPAARRAERSVERRK